MAYGGSKLSGRPTFAFFSGVKQRGALFSVQQNSFNRKPDWFKIRLNPNRNYKDLKHLVREKQLHTVCEEASCPNIHECWGRHRTAAFMILGDVCTRRCRFCDVKTGKPSEVDRLEPYRVARAVRSMELSHAFITMVNRDDLRDGGASVLADTVRAIHDEAPDCSVEVLTADLAADRVSIDILVQSKPEILGHNIETVRRLTPKVRSRSEYDRSLAFLRIVKEIDEQRITKSSIMLGLGENNEEVLESMDDLRRLGVDMLNIGQYLQPSRTNMPVEKYWHPDEFAELRRQALDRGFTYCESGPLVRSSYHAGEQFEAMQQTEEYSYAKGDTERGR
ncbi:MAG: lipoyl synthase [Spirochaetales bacterium]|nr:lipoyl synthase [Spirochaetales bacterium]